MFFKKAIIFVNLYSTTVLKPACTPHRSSNPLQTRACANTLPDSSELLLLSTKSTDRLKSLTVTDWYTRTPQHIKKPSKTIKENYHQPFSHAVLPQEICHRHLYFLFPPNFRNIKFSPLSATTFFTISERCFLQLPLQNVRDSKQSNTL